VLEQVLLFATSALRVRDTHSVNVVLLALRDMIPHFARPGPVHDFVCHDVLRAAITSLHEPYFVELQKDLASLIVYVIQLDAPPGRKAAGEEEPTEGADAAAAADPAAAVLASLPGLDDSSAGAARVSLAVRRVRALAPQSRAAAASAASAPASGEGAEAGAAQQQQQQREALVAHATSAHAQAQDMRAARAVVLDLLEQIRGVGIHEMGRIVAPAAAAAAAAGAGPRGGGKANGDGGGGRGSSRVVARAMQVDGAEGGPAGIVRGGSPDLDGVANLLN
jgi:hypothetical protein